jgi:hypothetical protein
MKWVRMPGQWGPYWFTPRLEDRDLAVLVRVSRHEYGDGTVEFTRSQDERVITPDEGWWLLIPDHRMTAEVEA